MHITSIKALIEAGAHFGHRASRWNPKMARFIHSRRNLVHIVDLKETLRGLVRARHFLSNIAATGGQVLFVGTKRQAKAIVAKIAVDCRMPSVSERWLGGMLTNYRTVRSRLARLEEIELMEKTGEIERFSKKMISAFVREKRKLLRNLEGVRTLNRLPVALVIVDPKHEEIAVKEALKLKIPVVALIDTDSDPDRIDFPIPCNDDAMRSIQMLLVELGEAVTEGAKKYAVGADERAKAKKASAAASPAGGGSEDKHRRPRSKRPRRPGSKGPGGPRARGTHAARGGDTRTRSREAEEKKAGPDVTTMPAKPSGEAKSAEKPPTPEPEPAPQPATQAPPAESEAGGKPVPSAPEVRTEPASPERGAETVTDESGQPA